MENNRIVVILIGPPGCGKGSTSQILCDDFKFLKVSTGDILRNEIKSQSDIGLRVKSTVSAGKLVSDGIIFQLVGEFMEKNKKSNLLFDGVPRNKEQALILDEVIKKQNLIIDLAVVFDVSDDVLVDRAVGRLVHPASGRVYHAKNYPPKVPNCDDVTGEPLVSREDDNKETIRHRIAEYKKSTLPMIKFFDEKGCVYQIDANGSLDNVIGKIKSRIQKVLIEKKKN